MKEKRFYTNIVLCLLLSLSFNLGTLKAQQNQTSEILFISPQKDDIWTGKQKIEIQLKNIPPDKVQLLELYLDGQLIKEFSSPPYFLYHDFKMSGHNHTLKVLVRGAGKKLLDLAVLKSYQVQQSLNIEVQQIIVPVTVKDKKGNHIRGLKKEDFILTSGKRPITISFMSTRGIERINMAQVIDISYSMQNKIHDVLYASEGFLKELLTKNDLGTIIFFNQRVYEHAGFSNNLPELLERLNLRSPVMGGTALYDSISYTLNLLKKKSGWNIMIVFSDGHDNCSYIDQYSLMEKVKKTPVVIYAIDNRLSGRNNVLEKICSVSGGSLFPLTNVKKIQKVYQKIKEEINSQYLLFFNPKTQSKTSTFKQFHPLTVKIKNKKKCIILNPKGYYY